MPSRSSTLINYVNQMKISLNTFRNKGSRNCNYIPGTKIPILKKVYYTKINQIMLFHGIFIKKLSKSKRVTRVDL